VFAAIVGQAWADDAHPFNLEINGIDRIAFLHWPTLRIEMSGPGSNGSMTFTLEDKDSSIPTINEWDEVRFIEHAAVTWPITFGGFVQSVKYVTWAAGGRSIVVTCVGYGILLDKKAVPSFALSGTSIRVTDHIVSAVNRHGGGVTGTCGVNPNTDFADTTWSMACPGSAWTLNVFTPVTIDANQTLRAVIEQMLRNGIYADGAIYSGGVGTTGPYWVDAYRRLVVYYDVPSPATFRLEQQYFGGTIPGLTVDEAGTVIVDELSYEREDTDRVTSAYVAGGAAPGTGYFRAPALERAGDLEVIVSASDSLVAGDIVTKGGAVVGQTSAATARGEVLIGSNTPLDIFPGRNIRVTSPRATLTAADWRITSTSIAFRSATYREYTVGFGGNIPQRSAMRRIGRLRTR
jgi:hypothetical protein